MRSLYPIKLVGDVLVLQYGKPLPESERTSEGGVPAYGANGVLCQSRQAFRTKPSIIVGRKGSAGEVNLTEGPFWPTDVTYFVEHDERVSDLRYLFYALRLLNLQKLAKGVKPGVNRNDVYGLKIPMPSLPEQKRIVALLDEAFEGIDTAIANAEKNRANARELFDSYVTSVFAQSGRDWREKKLGDICENLDSRRIPITKSERIKGDVPYYGASGIVDHVSGHLFDENVLLISEDGANLLARTYPIAFSVSGKSWVNNHAHVVRLDSIEFQKFVELYLNSISLVPYVSGMAQPKLNQKSLNSIPVPVPPIAEQLRIVETAEAFQTSVERLEEVYRRKLDALAELKQVVLQKAFAGELSAQSVEAVPEAAE